MAGTQLSPEKITSPFQLMAAWFAMLVLLVSVLLTAANNVTHPEWAAGYLVIFTSIIVVVVIACVILMLTAFRPHLQDGKEYAEWLKDKNTYSPGYLVKAAPGSQVAKIRKTTRLAVKNEPAKGKSFLISIVDAVGSNELVETLKNLGFNAEVYQERTSSPDKRPLDYLDWNEGIWIGSRVDSKSAIQALKIAVIHWPQLKYLHISTDGEDPPDYIHDQLFFGGVTAAAKRFGLRAWSHEELLALDDDMPLEAFHSAIRSKYS